MNIQQVNTVLDRALLAIHEDTEEALMALFDEEDLDEEENGDDENGDDEKNGKKKADSECKKKEEVEDPSDGADAQEEEYTGIGGTEPVDHSPMGDPETGDTGGVGNYSYELEAFLSYIAGIADDISGVNGYDYEAVMDAIEIVSGEMATSGEIPPMPHPDESTVEELSGWCLAATTAGFAGRVTEYMKANAPAE